MTWVSPVLAAIVASTAALIGSALILALGERTQRASIWLLAFAIGTLLGAAALGLLPEALERGPTGRTMLLFLAGIVGFIALERALRWRHPHEPHPEHTAHPSVERATTTMILWGDSVHNFVDGLVLGVSFGVSFEVGVASALAIFAHEVPQEIGDFAILIASGMPKRRAVLLNYLAALTPIPGALAAYAWSSTSERIIPWLLPVAAGGFVYIALADLVPALHHRRGTLAGLSQISLILLGIAVIYAIGGMTPHA